ncbi:hypothetical protein GIB67_021803 [Kingdonia uniflora]|uniref:Bifunctional inhibitor/plant lipid transfer protein/seed storage helical domain-containing protein n=1 Tax=Kingdonia uniflora TaxID=39325 RepID=A0A7J7P2N0_9MAGN|nr:hypothetical protein GIB67_021803 [Kingdonia uniflora]
MRMALMGSKIATLLILLNLIFFTCVSSHKVVCSPETPIPAVKPPKTPSPKPTTPTTKPPKTPSTTPATKPAKCPKDTLKLSACADLLGGLVSLVLGPQTNSKCCSLLSGLADLDAAVCLCTAIKANVLGIIKLDIPVALTLLINACGKTVPEDFTC